MGVGVGVSVGEGVAVAVGAGAIPKLTVAFAVNAVPTGFVVVATYPAGGTNVTLYELIVKFEKE